MKSLIFIFRKLVWILCAHAFSTGYYIVVISSTRTLAKDNSPARMYIFINISFPFLLIYFNDRVYNGGACNLLQLWPKENELLLPAMGIETGSLYRQTNKLHNKYTKAKKQRSITIIRRFFKTSPQCEVGLLDRIRAPLCRVTNVIIVVFFISHKKMIYGFKFNPSVNPNELVINHSYAIRRLFRNKSVTKYNSLNSCEPNDFP